jgi:uncharacterized membrane protein YhaH (DUF805 family)
MSIIIGLFLILIGVVDFIVANFFHIDIYEFIGIHLPSFISKFTPLIAGGIGFLILKYQDGEDGVSDGAIPQTGAFKSDNSLDQESKTENVKAADSIGKPSSKGVEPFKYLILPIKSTFNFKDRASRSEFWEFSIWCGLIFMLMSYGALKIEGDILQAFASPLGIAANVILLIMYVPLLSVSVRRLHDIGKSGWWLFAALIPFFGSIWIIYSLFKIGEVPTNKFGNNPKIHGHSFATNKNKSRTRFQFLIVVFYVFVLSAYVYDLNGSIRNIGYSEVQAVIPDIEKQVDKSTPAEVAIDIDPKDLRTAMMFTEGRWTEGDKDNCQDPLSVTFKDGGTTEVTFKGGALSSRFMKFQDEICLKVEGGKNVTWTWFCADAQGSAIAFDEAAEQKGAFESCKN